MTPIRFRNSTLARMANGEPFIELTEAGTWESFAPFAEALAEQIKATIVERLDFPDGRMWIIRIGEHELSLCYNDYPNSVSLEARGAHSNVLITQLFEVFRNQASSDGL